MYNYKEMQQQDLSLGHSYKQSVPKSNPNHYQNTLPPSLSLTISHMYGNRRSPKYSVASMGSCAGRLSIEHMRIPLPSTLPWGETGQAQVYEKNLYGSLNILFLTFCFLIYIMSNISNIFMFLKKH